MKSWYGAAPIDDVQLARKVAPHVRQLAGDLPDRDMLNEIKGQYGLDFASTVFYQAILASQRHGEFIRQVDRQEPVYQSVHSGVKLLILPAFMYKERPEIGSGGEHVMEVARACGLNATQVPLLSRGSVEENAGIIRDALQREQASSIWILSICKAGAELRLAMHRYRHQLPIEKIAFWFNVSGAVYGHDLIDQMTDSWLGRLRTRVVCATIGAHYSGIEQLRSTHPFWRDPLILPSSMRVVSVFGVPLAHHIQPRLFSKYKWLGQHGPNDGMLLLSNMMIGGGTVYPIWGADHFMRDARVVPLWYRLFAWAQSQVAANQEVTEMMSSAQMQ